LYVKPPVERFDDDALPERPDVAADAVSLKPR